MDRQNLFFGLKGENLAVDFLREKGYKILKRNYKTKLGEIDIIAEDKGTLAFVEVKARHTDRFGLPCAAVSATKQRQISKTALVFLKEKELLDRKARFDVVSIEYTGERPRLDLIKNAFELDSHFTY